MLIAASFKLLKSLKTPIPELIVHCSHFSHEGCFLLAEDDCGSLLVVLSILNFSGFLTFIRTAFEVFHHLSLRRVLPSFHFLLFFQSFAHLDSNIIVLFCFKVSTLISHFASKVSKKSEEMFGDFDIFLMELKKLSVDVHGKVVAFEEIVEFFEVNAVVTAEASMHGLVIFDIPEKFDPF
jgi:hypothetical protein